MIQFGGACARYRPALLDFVDRAEIGSGTEPALAHLDRCDRCTADLVAIGQTITALRRIGDEAGRVEPAEDAWPRLQARISRWRPMRSRIMSPIAGMAMSVALVAVLVVPLRFGTESASTGASPSLDAVVRTSAGGRIEANHMSAAGHEVVPDQEPATGSTGPRKYPDGIRPAWKDVPSDQVTLRPTVSK